MKRLILLPLVLGLAISARADVSDSGNLTIGGTGVIQGTMTVQGAAFSVGGTTFSVAGGNVTLGGRLNAAAAGIKWADGTTSTTASSGGGGAVAASTFTILSNETTEGVGVLTTVPGSEITLTCAGDVGVEAMFEGSMAQTSSGQGTLKWILIDGNYLTSRCVNASCSTTMPTPWSSTVSMGGPGRDPGAGSVALIPFTIHTPPIPCSAGSHTFTFVFKRTGGGVSYIACSAAGGTFTSSPCVFIVREVRR